MKTTLFRISQWAALSTTILLAQSCNSDDDAAVIAPKVTTVAASEITYSSAKVGGTITSDGGADITAKGIAYGTASAPTVANDTTNQGEGTDAFTATLTDLSPNTTYYFRAYATNKVGTSYGEELSFVTSAGLPTVALNLSFVSYKKATLSLVVTQFGASDINNSGLVYSESNATPTIEDTMWPSNSTEPIIDKLIEDLTPGTKYYFRAFAQNGQGMGYSNVVEVTTKSVPATITDVDGNVYGTALLGDNVWLTSDLKVTKYNNGDAIPTTVNGVDGEATPQYQWVYNNDDANATTYGRYYTFYAITDARKVCPAGTHVSSMYEWSNLSDVVAGYGTKLKVAGTTVWVSPNTNSNNETGFNGVGSGYRSLYGSFGNFKEYAFYLTPETGGSEEVAKAMYLSATNMLLQSLALSKKSGYSVRCVVD